MREKKKHNTCPDTGRYDWACDCAACVEERKMQMDVDDNFDIDRNHNREQSDMLGEGTRLPPQPHLTLSNDLSTSAGLKAEVLAPTSHPIEISTMVLAYHVSRVADAMEKLLKSEVAIDEFCDVAGSAIMQSKGAIAAKITVDDPADDINTAYRGKG